MRYSIGAAGVFIVSGGIDLSPVRGLPLRNLQCNVTPVSDLSPLKGMPLTVLGCGSTAVSDLSPAKI